MRTATLTTAGLLGLALLTPAYAASAAGETCRGLAATIVGTGPSVTGTEGADVIVTGSATSVSALGGDDVICVAVIGDTTSNVVEWTLKYDITGKNVNTNKLLVYHWDDATNALSPVGGIALKNNACKPSKPVDCGTASITGTTLTIVFRTGGNGKTRLLG